MKVRILDSSMVVNFQNIDFDAAEICSRVKSEVNMLIEPIKNEKLKNWEVHFIFSYNNVRQILIYTRGKSYPKEKYKEITTHIPIPTNDKVAWGVDIDQHVYENDSHLDHLMANFSCLNVKFSNFKNRADYISDCMHRTIKFCFEKGFTINGVKVKLDIAFDTKI